MSQQEEVFEALAEWMKDDLMEIERLRAELARLQEENQELLKRAEDAEQQCAVLRPGGLYAWKSKYEAAQQELQQLSAENQQFREENEKLKEGRA